MNNIEILLDEHSKWMAAYYNTLLSIMYPKASQIGEPERVLEIPDPEPIPIHAPSKQPDSVPDYVPDDWPEKVPEKEPANLQNTPGKTNGTTNH